MKELFRTRIDKRIVLSFFLCLLMFAFAVSFTMIGPLMPVLIEKYSLRLSQGGLIVSFQSIGAITALVAAGFLADVVSKSRLIALVFFSYTISLFVLGTAPEFKILLAFFWLLGASTRMLDTVLNAYVADIYPQRRSFYLLFLHIFFSIGALLGPLYSRIVLNRAVDWNYSFLILGFICLFIFLLYLVVMQNAPSGRSKSKPVRPGDVLGLLAGLRMWIIGLVMFMYLGSQVGLTVWLPMYMEDYLGADAFMASMALSLFWGGIIAGRIISSRLLERFSEINQVLWGALSGGLILCLALILENPIVLIIAVGMAGLLTGGTMPLLLAIACEWYPLNSGGATAIINLFGSLATMFFPWLIGVIAETISFKLGILLTGLLLLFVFLLSIPVSRGEERGKNSVNKGDLSATTGISPTDKEVSGLQET